MSRIRLLSITVLCLLMLADTVTAGLFGFGRRRWEQRKAELRSELVYDLSNKLDQDLTREVEAVTAKLTETARQQVKTESTKLEKQVTLAVSDLRKQASKLVAQEAARLNKQMDAQVKQLQQQAHQAVAAESAKLKQQTDQEIAKLNAKYTEQSKAIQATMQQQIANLPVLVSAQVEKSLQNREASVSKAKTEDNKPTPQPDKNASVSAAPEAAALTKPVELAKAKPDDQAD